MQLVFDNRTFLGLDTIPSFCVNVSGESSEQKQLLSAPLEKIQQARTVPAIAMLVTNIFLHDAFAI